MRRCVLNMYICYNHSNNSVNRNLQEKLWTQYTHIKWRVCKGFLPTFSRLQKYITYDMRTLF
jgi:hypothetical protein